MQKLAGKRGILAALDRELTEDATVEDASTICSTCKASKRGLKTSVQGAWFPTRKSSR